MDRSEQLEQIFQSTRLPSLLKPKKLQYYPDREFTALRFNSNGFRIRALEIWDKPNPVDSWFRIYHGSKIAPELKELIDGLDGFKRKTSTGHYTDFYGDPQEISKALGDLLTDGNVEQIVRTNPLARSSAYEGLVLPDIDVADTEVLGRTFTWRDLIAISEDDSDDNELRKILSQPGVYLQRSQDGTSRYVGSAYGTDGILGRWLAHLTSNGNAKHLNIFILENGYANVLFTVLEFTDKDQATTAESRWKETLGTRNVGIYDGLRLNSN